MTDLERIEIAIRNVLLQIKDLPWDTSIEKVLLMLADEIAKFHPGPDG